jgi:hypothetical protein
MTETKKVSKKKPGSKQPEKPADEPREPARENPYERMLRRIDEENAIARQK